MTKKHERLFWFVLIFWLIEKRGEKMTMNFFRAELCQMLFVYIFLIFGVYGSSSLSIFTHVCPVFSLYKIDNLWVVIGTDSMYI